jgi:hypothetical protein
MGSLNALGMTALTFLDCVWQFVAIVWTTRKMLRQQAARLPDRMDDSVGEMLRFEMRPHRLRQRFPKRLATLLVHASISNDRELLGAWRDKDQDGVPFTRLRHAKSFELVARIGHRVGHITTLNENADLARSFRFRGGNRPSDTIVFQFAEKFPCAHKHLPARSGAATAKTASATAEPTETATPA